MAVANEEDIARVVSQPARVCVLAQAVIGHSSKAFVDSVLSTVTRPRIAVPKAMRATKSGPRGIGILSAIACRGFHDGSGGGSGGRCVDVYAGVCARSPQVLIKIGARGSGRVASDDFMGNHCWSALPGFEELLAVEFAKLGMQPTPQQRYPQLEDSKKRK